MSVTNSTTVVINQPATSSNTAEAITATTFTPTAYPAVFTLGSGAIDAHFKNVMCWNCYVGVDVNGGSRFTFDGLWGEPLKRLLLIENATDVIHGHNMHAYPFWSLYQFTAPQLAAVYGWQMADAAAIESQRDDNPQFSDVYIFGVNTGLLLSSSSSGITSLFNTVNWGCDAAKYCVHATAGPTKFAGINVIADGADPRYFVGTIGGSGFKFDVIGVLQLTNASLSVFGRSAVEFTDPGSGQALQQTFQGSNLVVDSWSGDGSGYPAINMSPGSTSDISGLSISATNITTGAADQGILNSCGTNIRGLVLSGLATSSAPSVATLDGQHAAAGPANQIPIPPNCSVSATINIIGRDTVNGNTWNAQHTGTFKRSAGAPSVVGSITYTPLGQDSGFAVGDAVTVDTTNNAIGVGITQTTNANPVTWRSVVNLVEAPNQ